MCGSSGAGGQKAKLCLATGVGCCFGAHPTAMISTNTMAVNVVGRIMKHLVPTNAAAAAEAEQLGTGRSVIRSGF
jgi:hypothetical protein